MQAYPLTALTVCLIVLLQFWFMVVVGRERGRSKIKAPALTGDPGLERALRVQGNTIEQLMMFLPALWLSLPVLGDLFAALTAGLWIIGRLHYGITYQRDPAARGPGFVLTLLALAVALIAALSGVLLTWLNRI